MRRADMKAEIERLRAEVARLQHGAQAHPEGQEAQAAEGKGAGEAAAGPVAEVAKPGEGSIDLNDVEAESPDTTGEQNTEADDQAEADKPNDQVSDKPNDEGRAGNIGDSLPTRLRVRDQMAAALRMEAVVEACRRMAEGQALTTICNDPDMPSVGTFLRWCHEDAEIGQMYIVALRLRAAGMAEEIVTLADEAAKAPDSASVQAYKLRVDTRKWVASRLLPKQYGDHQIIEHTGEVKLDEKQIDARLAHLVGRIKGNT